MLLIQAIAASVNYLRPNVALEVLYYDAFFHLHAGVREYDLLSHVHTNLHRMH